jgi:diaminohydroxyphosphoribosylaminopyrimidine deaminase / 5-amino-6-(5-phosphoribosylamino)uracil reductase
VEGGFHTLQSLIEAGLWDEARIFSAPVVIGEGIRAPKIPDSIGNVSREQIEQDTLTYIHRHD